MVGVLLMSPAETIEPLHQTGGTPQDHLELDAGITTFDSEDNDCDDATDEYLLQTTTCGEGQCSGNTGVAICSEGGWINDTCDPLLGASAEACDNRDNDCNGITDEGYDVDTDGYSMCGGDCNDADAVINLGAVEIPGNGINDDCNPITLDSSPDTDGDSDGYSENDGDCNDTDPLINPAAAEIPDNGIDDDGNGWVDDVLDVLAPGELIWSTAVLSAYDGLLYDFLGMLGWEPGDDTYASADGTSFAAPLVSGYVGLILSQNPGATLSQVREVIRSNALDILDPHGVGDSLLGYDAYSGFGRMRMVVATIIPDANDAPFADAGPDQTVPDKGKPGEERVTLDGSGSYDPDPDGNIISYEWFEAGERIASGETVTVKLPVGPHTITLQVTDDRLEINEDQVTITITSKNGDPPDEGGSSGPQSDMGVYEMTWSAKNNLDLTVNIRCNSNGNTELDGNDAPVSEATVTLELTQALSPGGTVQNIWTFDGRTDSSGNFRAKVPKAPDGHYQATITGLSHDIHEHDPNLDADYLDVYTK